MTEPTDDTIDDDNNDARADDDETDGHDDINVDTDEHGADDDKLNPKTKSHKDDIAHHPHDGLVKRIFSDPKTAAVELRQVLPAKLCERLDWDSLHVESSSFIDPKLKPRHSDILYTIAIAGSTRRISLYTVLEHQSSPDAKMAARFIIYIGRLYERYIRLHENSTTVPMVIPILLYQGPSGWTLPRCLSESLDVPPDLLELFPSPIELTFAVDDLEQSLLGEEVTRDQLARDRHLAQAEMARTMLWLYKHPEASTGARAAALGILLEFITETWGPNAIQPFVTYLLSAFPNQTPIRAIIEGSLNPEARHMYMTIRDELIAQGRADGKADGKAEGKAEGMGQMLARLLDTRGLALTDQLRKRIAHCKDEALLQRWFDRAVTATTLTEVFDD
ncbi:MAG: Rpn family recombination-promoting nuclease/putative transposase [Myxococcota bacterium]